MTSRRRQQGWYNGAYMVTAVLAIVLFMAQPWIPLLLLAAMGGAAVVIAIARGGRQLQQWLRQHHPHLH
ncbi:hypothetical protein [Vogesella oryzae]|uniref:hypothetical protein n=1 Tax=Vogesella oryzae TaxID=1735285 RepID=UPI0015829CD2|nr:hypothetical protein [Vogesella oryzae]